MGRLKTVETVTQQAGAIQIVRTALSDVYDFNEHRDMSVSFKNDKLSGTLRDEKGTMISFVGKDWLVKDMEGHIKVYSPEVFAATFHITGDK